MPDKSIKKKKAAKKAKAVKKPVKKTVEEKKDSQQAVPVSGEKSGSFQAPVKSKKKKVIVAIAVVAAVLLIVGEIAFVVSKQGRANKKPILISTWDVKYGGQIGMPVSGNHLYVIDSNWNQIQKREKINGKHIITYKFDITPLWAGENSAGEVFVMLRNQDKIFKMEGTKPVEYIKGGLQKAINFVIDSDDNFVVADGGSAKIIKFNPQGEKMLEMGGRGSGKGKFFNIGKVTIDHKDNIYAIDTGTPLMVKSFSKQGDFIREWKLPLARLHGLENLAVTNDGNVYINDWNDATIKVFNSRGKALGKFTHNEGMTYKIGAPGAFSGGWDNYIYVGSHNVAVFEPIDY